MTLPKNADRTPTDDGSTTAYFTQQTEMMRAMSLSIAMGNALWAVRPFDGSNITLKDFIDDIRSGAAYVPSTETRSYISAVIGKLRGPAKDCVSEIQEDFIDYTYLDPYKYSPEPTGSDSMHSPGEPLYHIEIVKEAPGGAEDSDISDVEPVALGTNMRSETAPECLEAPKDINLVPQ